MMNGEIALQRDGHRHENRPSHGHGQRRKKNLGKEQSMYGRTQAKVPTKVFQDGTHQEPTIEAQERDQKHIECVFHFISVEYKDYFKI